MIQNNDMLMRTAFADELMNSDYLKKIDIREETKLSEEQPILNKLKARNKRTSGIMGASAASVATLMMAFLIGNGELDSKIAIAAATIIPATLVGVGSYSQFSKINLGVYDKEMQLARIDRLNSKKVKISEKIKTLANEEEEDDLSEEILELKIAKQFIKSRIYHYQVAHVSVSIK